MPKILPIMMGLVRLTALVFVALVCTALVYGMFYYAKPRHFGFLLYNMGFKEAGMSILQPYALRSMLNATSKFNNNKKNTNRSECG